jgi:hypothetical protein
MVPSSPSHHPPPTPPSSPVFVIFQVFDDNNSDWGKVESQYSFDLHFPDG